MAISHHVIGTPENKCAFEKISGHYSLATEIETRYQGFEGRDPESLGPRLACASDTSSAYQSQEDSDYSNHQ